MTDISITLRHFGRLCKMEEDESLLLEGCFIDSVDEEEDYSSLFDVLEWE